MPASYELRETNVRNLHVKHDDVVLMQCLTCFISSRCRGSPRPRCCCTGVSNVADDVGVNSQRLLHSDQLTSAQRHRHVQMKHINDSSSSSSSQGEAGSEPVRRDRRGVTRLTDVGSR